MSQLASASRDSSHLAPAPRAPSAPPSPTSEAETSARREKFKEDFKSILGSIQPEKKWNRPADSKTAIFCSEHGRISIAAFDNACASRGEAAHIHGVPIDNREAARVVFHRHFDLVDQQATLPVGGRAPRFPLLCCFGIRGSGKTTLQALNMQQFMARYPDCLAVESTFNDDQSDLCDARFLQELGIVGRAGIRLLVAVRILHRLVASVLRLTAGEAGIEFTDRFSLVLAALRPLGGHALDAALHVVRHFAGKEPTAWVLLIVDEIAQAATKLGVPPAEILSELTSFCDEFPNVYLSTTVYDCVDLKAFTTGSSRPLSLQSLGPILIFSEQQIRSLPRALQELSDQQICKLFMATHKKKAKRFLFNFAKVLLLAGGHPRRWQYLLQYFAIVCPKREATLEMFMDAVLLRDLFVTEAEAAMNMAVDYSNLSSVKDLRKLDLNALAGNVSAPFKFPTDATSALQCQGFLLGTQQGLCSFVSKQAGDFLEGHAFLPLPVLQNLAKLLDEDHLPRATALLQLSDAICKYSLTPKSTSGQPFEVLTEMALLLHFRCNKNFELSTLCHNNPAATELLSATVKAGVTTQHITNVPFFPVDPKPEDGEPVRLTAEAKAFFEEQTDCAKVCRLTTPNNAGVDIMCLLPLSNSNGKRILLLVECKDRPVIHQDVVKHWKFNRSYFCNSFIDINAQQVRNPVPAYLERHNITPVFLLFSSNPIHEFVLRRRVRLDCNMVVTDFVQMRQWQPTTAFAADCAHRIRRLFWPDSSDKAAHEGRSSRDPSTRAGATSRTVRHVSVECVRVLLKMQSVSCVFPVWFCRRGG